MKTLTLISVGLARPDKMDIAKKEAADEMPRVSLYEQVLESELLDETYMQRVPAVRRFFYRYLPTLAAQVLEAYIVRHRYDLIITWAERLGLPFALLLKLSGSRTPHITLNSWVSTPKKARVLRFVHSHIDRILMWSSVQREFAINVIGVPPEKIAFVRKFADQQFWRPMEIPTDMISAAGMEMRDYPTLIEAMRGLDIRCHIAAGRTRGHYYDTVRTIWGMELPPNVTVEPRDYFGLRELYARSRFVVVPLRETDTDNGLTCILEAMAMGKAVICSRTKGQVDVVQDGKTGFFVPQGDPVALREAIAALWNNPQLADQMGKAGRRHLEERHTIEQFVNSVRRIAEEVLTERNGRPTS